MIENHSSSYSLLAFCGSPQLAREIQYHKISNDMVTAITGHKKHQMELVSESYGGQSSKSGRETDKKQDVSSSAPNTAHKEAALSTRQSTFYYQDEFLSKSFRLADAECPTNGSIEIQNSEL